MAQENSRPSAEGKTLTANQRVEVVEIPSQDHTRDSTKVAEASSPVSPGHARTSTSADKRLSQSIRIRQSHESRRNGHAPTPTVPQASPINRFRGAVRKVMALHRTSTIIFRGRLGAEPGVDPRRHSAFAQYGHVRERCVIDVIDYSSVRCSVGRMTNKGFVDFLENDRASAREPWVKVRWINIGGVSWDVISALALKYEMHPLSVEDILHRRGHALSKADYYPKHLFIRVLCHTLDSAPSTSQSSWRNAASSSHPPFTELPRSASPQRFNEKVGKEDVEFYEKGYDDNVDLMPDVSETGRTTLVDPELGGRRTSLLADNRKRAVAEVTLDELKKGERVGVHIEPMCIFLFRDGTVISFNSKPNLDLTEPITMRIRQRDSSLRTTADPSILVESLLDLIVDAALEVVDEYRARLSVLERLILIKSKVSTVRSLHILSGDLILHKRTLGPVKALIYALRAYDVDRAAACLDLPESGDHKVVGYMSNRAMIYLADVLDHIEYAITSLDMYSAMAENLINYTFNMASYETNEVMRTLTLCTILFLPLTLLTGYFGMNFQNMWTIQHGHSDLVFWIIAIPVMCIVTPAFLWSDIVRLYHFIKKRSLARNVTKVQKRLTEVCGDSIILDGVIQ